MLELGESKVSALGVEKQRVKVVLSLQNPPKALGHGYRVDARVTVLERPTPCCRRWNPSPAP